MFSATDSTAPEATCPASRVAVGRLTRCQPSAERATSRSPRSRLLATSWAAVARPRSARAALSATASSSTPPTPRMPASDSTAAPAPAASAMAPSVSAVPPSSSAIGRPRQSPRRPTASTRPIQATGCSRPGGSPKATSSPTASRTTSVGYSAVGIAAQSARPTRRLNARSGCSPRSGVPNRAQPPPAPGRRCPAAPRGPRVPPLQVLPQTGPVPARLAPPLVAGVVEPGVGKEHGDHLLTVAVPEPQTPGGGDADAAVRVEESGTRHPTQPRLLGRGGPVMIVDTEVEVPGAGVHGEVTVEHGELRRRREADLVGRALDDGAGEDLGPVVAEHLGEE